MTDGDAGKLFTEFGIRMAAVIIDIFAAMFLTFTALGALFELSNPPQYIKSAIAFAVLFLYFPAFWVSPLRATPIQFLFGMRVVDQTGDRLSFGRAVVRSVTLIALIVASLTLYKIASNAYFSIVAFLGLASVFLAALNTDRQAVHDLLSKSIVVNKIALNTEEHHKQLLAHLSDSNPESRRKHRPPILTILGNLFVLGVPVGLILFANQVAVDRSMRYRTDYAVQAVGSMQLAIEDSYDFYGRWPSGEIEMGFPDRVDYPDGGYYELEENGVIRIRFTVKPELITGSIYLRPTPTADGMTWECRTDGGFRQRFVRPSCRD